MSAKIHVPTLKVMIEIPKGSRNKYEYDPVNDCIRFDRMLYSSVHYPCDYGFVTDTLAGDGDPLDVLVMVAEATFPGCMIEARPVGLFIMKDEKGRDEKILCVPVRDPLLNHVKSLRDVPPHLLTEIEHFFEIYKELENKVTEVEGWMGLPQALKVIRQSQEAHQKSLARPAKRD